MKTIGFIPSRYGSTRLLAKSLTKICGKYMVQWVYENTKKATKLDDLIVLTDDMRIADVCKSFGAKFKMTSPDCQSGTERILSVLNDFDFDIAINIQGDEPLVNANDIDNLITSFEKDSSVLVSTLIKKIPENSELNNPNLVKVVLDANNNAIYFSRSKIPFNRDGLERVNYYQHIGIYGYTKQTLQNFNNLPSKNLENIEKLEQLRFLENGIKIKSVETNNIYVSVDIKEDLEKVEKVLNDINV